MALNHRIALLLGLILMLAGLPALAVEPAVLNSSRESVALGPHVTYAVDSKGRADANLMFGMAARKRFKPLPGDSAAFGFTEGAHWLHARLFNQDSREQRWLLVLHYPLLDNVDVYVRYPDGRIEHSASGDKLPFSARSIRYRHPNFWVDLPQRTEVELLVRVSSRSSLQAPLALYTPTAFAELERDSQFGIGLFYGILFALLSYNLVLLARFGGEEFVVAIPDVHSDQLLQIAEKLRLSLCSEPVRYAGNNIPVSASIGAYLLRPGSDVGIDQALHLADDAMYMAKNRGRNCVHVATLG